MLGKYKTREEYLVASDTLLNRDVFNKAGITSIPANVVYSCSFATTGNRIGAKHITLGQCFDPACSSDKVNFQIVITPLLDDILKVLATQVHEKIHKIVGLACGHKGAFPKMCKQVGLKGKPSETYAGPELTATLQEIANELGPYPHSALDTTGRQKQSTRNLLCECSTCGMKVRASKTALANGAPHCSDLSHGRMEVANQ